MKKVVYCGQFMDLSGYGIAARKYLEILDLVASKNNIELKAYISLSPFAPPDLSTFSPKEQKLIEKYCFNSNTDIDEFIKDNDYECIWHMPTAMALFADEKFPTPKNISEPALLKIITSAKRNHHLVVWETTDISTEWKECLEWIKPHSIITACEMNTKMYSNYCENVLLAPHPIFDIDNVKPTPMNLPIVLDDKFVVFSMSQWTHRKGFEKLLKAFTAELGDKDDCVLVLKTFGSGEAPTPKHVADNVNNIRAGIIKENKKNNVLLMADYLPESNINWLYKNSNIFALLPRGEGFGLTIFESVLNGIPVLVPSEGGHVDYISKDNKFMVDGMWDSCVTADVAYPLHSEWFESNISSARKKLKLAYDMWKQNKLAPEGEMLKNALLNNKDFDPTTIAQNIIDFVTKDDNKIYTNKENKRNKLKKSMSLVDDLQSKIDILKDSYSGETLYVLSCGPSLGEYDKEYLKDFLADKPTLSIKQAYNDFSDVTDFHFFNCANLPNPIGHPVYRHYKYDEDKRPIIVSSSNYDLGRRWHRAQKQDIFFKIPIRTEINNEFVTVTKKFDDFLIDNNLTRPCGPGIMYETVFYMAAHMGFKEIICLGWDLRQEDPNADTYEHFYGSTEDVFNRGDILDWEIKVTRDASKELYYWLKEKNIELKVASSSAVYENIERIKI
jgi:glycosyltransferase involved in cell wall biosynthesis